MSVSFKVILQSPGKEREIRRFTVDREVSTSLAFLHHKVAAIFPALGRRETILSWEDGEGDEVMIGTDEELVTALTEMEGPVYRLRARVGEGRRGEEVTHPGVVCDGCNGCVTGHRYKCLHCRDYDLCSQCQTRGLHSHHTKVRIPAPRGCRIQGPGRHLIGKTTRTLLPHCHNPSLGVILGEVVRTVGEDMQETGREHTAADKKEGGTESQGDTEKVPHNAKDNLCSQSPSVESHPVHQFGSILIDVFGPALASAVFPVLETIVKCHDKVETEEKNDDPEGKGKEQAKVDRAVLEKDEIKASSVESGKEEVKSGFNESEKETVETETVESVKEETNTDRVESEKEKPAQHDDTKEDGEFEVVTKPEMEDPRVAMALAAMKEMGFTDEGGWLSSLLRSKSGDVGRAVQELRPGQE